MNKLTLVMMCLFGFLVPVMGVIAMNQDKVFVQDTGLGQLLYFPRYT